MAPPFSYADAFDRNLGWFTETEQQALRSKTIAIAGMGGVGGVHLLTLVRLGFTKFRIADLDVFEVANFNRQFFKICGRTPSDYRRNAHKIGTEARADPFREIGAYSAAMRAVGEKV